MEIHRSARRHQVPDEDISHAYAHPVAWIELGDDPLRYLLAGADQPGTSWSWSCWRCRTTSS